MKLYYAIIFIYIIINTGRLDLDVYNLYQLRVGTIIMINYKNSYHSIIGMENLNMKIARVKGNNKQ